MSGDCCWVPECAALARPGKTTCPIHAFARLAKDYWYHGETVPRLKCAMCKRVLRKTDWIHDEDGAAPRHVRCEPAAPRVSMKTIRESEKPLLEACCDADD